MDSITDWQEWRFAGYNGLPVPLTFDERDLHAVDEYDWDTNKWLNLNKAEKNPSAPQVFDQDKPMDAGVGASQDRHLALVQETTDKEEAAAAKAAGKSKKKASK